MTVLGVRSVTTPGADARERLSLGGRGVGEGCFILDFDRDFRCFQTSTARIDEA